LDLNIRPSSSENYIKKLKIKQDKKKGKGSPAVKLGSIAQSNAI